ncbi:MFS transporter [Micromonospora pisi]|uniref:MFS transporter n=1 Tax=Micromonospora pisi TaxID=589240 RepID=A0A495JF24_9ACTN|nr:MFS transporter [Micromonospora pisi]RKR87321.1 MFS transporter [Micromonospora pisi]
MAWATLANTVGTGLWGAGAALFLTRSVGLPVTSVGVGLTVAAVVGLGASVPLGHLADRRDPRTLRAVLQLGQAVVAASYLLVGSFATFLVVAVLDALLLAGNLTVRAALVAAVAGPGGRVRAFATLRAVANVGISVGAALAGLALTADNRTGYVLLALGNAVTYLVSAGLLTRLPALPPTAGGMRAGGGLAALRDRPYLAVGAAASVISLHAVVLTLVLPLWIAGQAHVPRATVSAVLVTNAVLTVLLTVRLSHGVRDTPSAARTMRRAGIVLAAAMLLYASSAGLATGTAVGLLLFATVVYTVGDLYHANASAGLSYNLADPAALGQYQGVFGLVTGLAQAAGPALLTLLLIGGGRVGWVVLAVMLSLAGSAVPALTRRARRGGGE